MNERLYNFYLLYKNCVICIKKVVFILNKELFWDIKKKIKNRFENFIVFEEIFINKFWSLNLIVILVLKLTGSLNNLVNY